MRRSGPLLAETAQGMRDKKGARWLVDLIEAKTDEEFEIYVAP